MSHLTSLDDLLTDFYGPRGTPRRDRHERNSRRRLRAWRIADRVLRPWPTFMQAFWWEVFDRGSFRGTPDALAFSCLGDFLFHGRPVTEDYYQSWVSRVHLPAWMRLR